MFLMYSTKKKKNENKNILYSKSAIQIQSQNQTKGGTCWTSWAAKNGYRLNVYIYT